MKPIYLDYNATTPVDPAVVKVMEPYLLQHFGNPSSSHHYGVIAKKAIGKARQQVANLIGAEISEIVFTSGGTESNNHAIRGVAYRFGLDKNHIITTQIEHPAVINVCQEMEKEGYDVTYLPVDKWGILDIDELTDSIKKETCLISVMYANNEIGSIQPIAEIGKIAQKNNIIFHTDAAQAVGKIGIDVKKSNIDLLSLAGHKFYAPKGVGALYINKNIEIKNLMHGASQEDGRRPGTENVPEIVGLGKAAEIANDNILQSVTHQRKMRDLLLERLSENEQDFIRNGHPTKCLPNTLSLSFAGLNSEELRQKSKEVAFSTGAACHSEKNNESSVLQAIKIPANYASGTVRLSTGKFTSKNEIIRAAQYISKLIDELQAK